MALDLRPMLAEQQLPVPPRPMSRRPGILETKLLIPRQMHPLVARPRLTDRLAGDPQVPLVGVFAPAGAGKTTLLVQWAAMDRRAVAWLTLTSAGADPTARFPYVAAAIDRATGLPGQRPRSGRRKLRDPDDWQTTLSQLGRALADDARATARRCSTTSSVSAAAKRPKAIVALSALLPAGSQLAVSSRRVRRVPVPRLVTAGLMTLIERETSPSMIVEAEELLHIVGLRSRPTAPWGVGPGVRGVGRRTVFSRR